MSRPDVVHVYRDQSEHGLWRWRRKASNGKKISGSEEAFSSHAAAVRAAKRANDGRAWRMIEDDKAG